MKTKTPKPVKKPLNVKRLVGQCKRLLCCDFSAEAALMHQIRRTLESAGIKTKDPD